MIDGAGLQSRLRALPILALVCLAAGASRARAEEPVVAWSAPEGCPDQPAVRARVGQLLARSHVSQPLSATGRITPSGDGYALSLELDQGSHHASRLLEDPSCASLAEAAAFLIAVTVDPNLQPAEEPAAEPPPPQPGPQPEARAGSPKPVEPEPEVPQAAPSVEGYRAALTVGAFHAGLAGPSAELGLAAGLTFSWLRVELRGGHVFARTDRRADEGVRGRFASQHLGVAACPEWGSRIRGGPCAWVAGLRTQATTRGLPGGRELSLFWAAAGLSLAARARLSGPLELSLEAGAGLPVTARPRFVVAGAGTIGEVAYLSGYVRLGIGFELR
jgi:hypothetical protein